MSSHGDAPGYQKVVLRDFRTQYTKQSSLLVGDLACFAGEQSFDVDTYWRIDSKTSISFAWRGHVTTAERWTSMLRWTFKGGEHHCFPVKS